MDIDYNKVWLEVLATIEDDRQAGEKTQGEVIQLLMDEKKLTKEKAYILFRKLSRNGLLSLRRGKKDGRSINYYSPKV